MHRWSLTDLRADLKTFCNRRTSRESNSFLPEYQKYLFRSKYVVFLWWQILAQLLVSIKTITDPVADVLINFHIA